MSAGLMSDQSEQLSVRLVQLWVRSELQLVMTARQKDWLEPLMGWLEQLSAVSVLLLVRSARQSAGSVLPSVWSVRPWVS